MALEQLKIREIVDDAIGKKLDVPEFQRPFVWDPEQVKLLAESLYRDYPVGSFLLWDSTAYEEAKHAQGAEASRWIVDGQQRTTALCLLFGMKPYWWAEKTAWNKALDRYDVLMDVGDDGEDGRPQFGLPNPIRSKDPRWVSVRRVLSTDDDKTLTPLATEIAQAIQKESWFELFPDIHARLQHLWQVRNREIPLVKVGHEVEDVAEIFARLNQEGTRVREADVILALAAARNPGWVRGQYLPFVEKLEDAGWPLEAGVYVRAMTGIGHGRARLIEVPKEFWSPEKLPGVWKQASAVIAGVVKRLGEFGILSLSLLPSRNSLIPLIVLVDRWQDDPSFSFPQALHWFLLANRDGRYSGSAITALNQDVRSIKDAETFDDAIGALTERLNATSEFAPEDFHVRYDRAANRFARTILYLLVYHNDGRDWVDGTLIAYDKAGGAKIAGFEPQASHLSAQGAEGRRSLRRRHQSTRQHHASQRAHECAEAGRETTCRVHRRAPHLA